jgi:hypothetical protein
LKQNEKRKTLLLVEIFELTQLKDSAKIHDRFRVRKLERLNISNNIRVQFIQGWCGLLARDCAKGVQDPHSASLNSLTLVHARFVIFKESRCTSMASVASCAVAIRADER